MTNSQYDRLAPLWQIVSDAYQGVETIKGSPNAFRYLPPQPAERAELEKNPGGYESTRYAFRKRLATYENIFKPTIDDICGLMQKNKPRLRFGMSDDDESPEVVRNMQWRGNRYNDGVYGLKTRVNASQALFGRYGLLLDVVTDADGLQPQFCITEYGANAILDGDYCETSFDTRKRLRWALLDESTRKFNPHTKTWIDWPRRRLVALDGEGRYYNAVFEGADVNGTWAGFNLDAPVESERYALIYPTYAGKTLNFIPFTVCNVDRLGIEFWQSPPYLDVAQVAVGNYCVDSLYKTALYQFASPTLVVMNAARESDDVRLGGVIWAKSGGANPVDVKLLETSGSGLGELRSAKEELKASLKYSSIRDLLDGAGANSSGDALKLRTASGTAAIATMDKTGARAIEEQLIFAAIWAGATFKEAYDRISFESDVTYLGEDFQIQSVVAFMQANKDAGLLSRRNVYSVLERTFPGVITDFEDNEAQLQDESDAESRNGATAQLLEVLRNFQGQSAGTNEEGGFGGNGDEREEGSDEDDDGEKEKDSGDDEDDDENEKDDDKRAQRSAK